MPWQIELYSTPIGGSLYGSSVGYINTSNDQLDSSERPVKLSTQKHCISQKNEEADHGGGVEYLINEVIFVGSSNMPHKVHANLREN